MLKPSKECFADNLRALMDRFQLTSEKLHESSKASLKKVSLKTINNLIAGRHAASLDTVDTIANVFQLAGWQIIGTSDLLQQARAPIERKSFQQGICQWPQSNTQSTQTVGGSHFESAANVFAKFYLQNQS